MADKSTGAKRIGRDTVRSMGLDPDKDYAEAAKNKASELVEDMGVGARNAGRLYGKSIGMDVGPYEKESGGVRFKNDAERRQLALDDYRRANLGSRSEAGQSALKNMKEFGMKKGGKVSSASSRADGIAQRGKTRGKMC